jgi:hypothetical protein
MSSEAAAVLAIRDFPPAHLWCGAQHRPSPEKNIINNFSTPCCPPQSHKKALARMADGRADAKDREGRTELHVAVEASGGVERVRELLARGWRVDEVDARGRTPFLLALEVAAVTGSSLAVAQVLASDLAGAKPPMQADSTGRTPLHWLVRCLMRTDRADRAGSELLDLCLRQGASTDAETSSGDTPLHWLVDEALERPSAASVAVLVARKLLDAGASPLVPDGSGQTARERLVRSARFPAAGDPSALRELAAVFEDAEERAASAVRASATLADAAATAAPASHGAPLLLRGRRKGPGATTGKGGATVAIRLKNP